MISLQSVSFVNNSVVRGGGGLYLMFNVALQITSWDDIIFTNNSALDGGGMFLDNRIAETNLSIGSTSFLNNTATPYNIPHDDYNYVQAAGFSFFTNTFTDVQPNITSFTLSTKKPTDRIIFSGNKCALRNASSCVADIKTIAQYMSGNITSVVSLAGIALNCPLSVNPVGLTADPLLFYSSNTTSYTAKNFSCI